VVQALLRIALDLGGIARIGGAPRTTPAESVIRGASAHHDQRFLHLAVDRVLGEDSLADAVAERGIVLGGDTVLVEAPTVEIDHALKDVKEGDQLTVHLGFTTGGAAECHPAETEPLGRRPVAATAAWLLPDHPALTYPRCRAQAHPGRAGDLVSHPDADCTRTMTSQARGNAQSFERVLVSQSR
jgi:hypothetical protein